MVLLVFWMTPENVLLASPLPTVSVEVADPERLSMVPVPDSAPTPTLKPSRSRTPLEMVAAPLVDPSAVVLPTCSVPLLTVVPPV